jgi:hypothetical protein
MYTLYDYILGHYEPFIFRKKLEYEQSVGVGDLNASKNLLTSELEVHIVANIPKEKLRKGSQISNSNGLQPQNSHLAGFHGSTFIIQPCRPRSQSLPHYRIPGHSTLRRADSQCCTLSGLFGQQDSPFEGTNNCTRTRPCKEPRKAIRCANSAEFSFRGKALSLRHSSYTRGRDVHPIFYGLICEIILIRSCGMFFITMLWTLLSFGLDRTARHALLSNPLVATDIRCCVNAE